MHYLKQPPCPVLKEWPQAGHEPYLSTLLLFLVDSQIFVIVQVTYFIFSGSQLLKMHQLLSVYQGVDLSQHLDLS